jgi:hypothetical protein
MDGPRCTACGGTELEPGFLEDAGENSRGFLRWIPGPLERGMFGGARRMGKPRHEVATLRCQNCSHLELYVAGPA